MLAFEVSNRDFRRIWLYYVVRNNEDAVYDTEISQSYLNAESYVDYVLWESGASREGSPPRQLPPRSHPWMTTP